MSEQAYVEVHNYRGPVRPCEHCRGAEKPPELRSYCKFCMTNGYVAECLNCNGHGIKTSKDGWGGGLDQNYPCNICGGNGCLPTPKPSSIETVTSPTLTPKSTEPADKLPIPPVVHESEVGSTAI